MVKLMSYKRLSRIHYQSRLEGVDTSAQYHQLSCCRQIDVNLVVEHYFDVEQYQMRMSMLSNLGNSLL